MKESTPMADKVIEFLKGRRHFDGWWENIEDYIQQEIKEGLEAELNTIADYRT